LRALLLNPPAENVVIETPDTEGEGYLESEDFGAFPPLGLLYIAAYLEKYRPDVEVTVLDCVGERVSQAGLAGRLESLRPDVVGITSFTTALVDVVMAAKTVRGLFPDAHLCLGGHHPIAFPFEAARLPYFDSIVVGEGEVPFLRLVEAVESGADFTEITGVYTRESIERHRGAAFKDDRFLTHVMVPPAYNEDLDRLPHPARSHIRHISYHSVLGVTDKLATIISSRGCPYRCTYCDVPYKRYRGRDVRDVVDEVEECLAMGYEEFHFYDDLFNISPEKVVAFCDEVDRRGLKFTWDFRGRINTSTRESLARAKATGLRLISFGIETGTDEGLKAVRKNITTAQVREVVGWCRELGIKVVADFMIGFPFEHGPEDIGKSVDYVIDIDPDYVQFSVLSLYPNTQLFVDGIKAGLVDPGRWERFAAAPEPGFEVDHWTEHMSALELVRQQRRAYKRFYLRPGYILRQALQLRSWFELGNKIKGFFKLLR